MDKSLSKNRVAAVRAYLEGIGLPVSQVQAYEVVARANGYANKHVLAAANRAAPVKPQSNIEYLTSRDGAVLRVFGIDSAPYTLEELRSLNGKLDAVIAVPVNTIDYGNHLDEYLAQRLTGKTAALENFQFSAYPFDCGARHFALRVSGEVDVEKLADWPVVIGKDTFMSELELDELCRHLRNTGEHSLRFTVIKPEGAIEEKVVVSYNKDGLAYLKNIFPLMRRAQDEHEKNRARKAGEPEVLTAKEDLDEVLSESVLEYIDTATQSRQQDGEFLGVEELAHAKKVGVATWMLEMEGRPGWVLRFE